MSDWQVSGSQVHDEPLSVAWYRFWFSPASMFRLSAIRALLCLVAAIYFLSSFSDLAFWYVDDRPASTENLAMFVRAAGLESEAGWSISPLFWMDSWVGSNVWLYRCYLLSGIVISGAVALGKGGRWCGWILWLLVVGWANRSLMLCGLVESLLSLSLFAVAIGPPSIWKKVPGNSSDQHDRSTEHWAAGFALRLVAVQFTIIAFLTTASMLGGAAWWNGTGAYALAAPIEDRLLDVRDSGSALFSRDRWSTNHSHTCWF